MLTTCPTLFCVPSILRGLLFILDLVVWCHFCLRSWMKENTVKHNKTHGISTSCSESATTFHHESQRLSLAHEPTGLSHLSSRRPNPDTPSPAVPAHGPSWVGCCANFLFLGRAANCCPGGEIDKSRSCAEKAEGENLVLPFVLC